MSFEAVAQDSDILIGSDRQLTGLAKQRLSLVNFYLAVRPTESCSVAVKDQCSEAVAIVDLRNKPIGGRLMSAMGGKLPLALQPHLVFGRGD
jgi:hypothetical protein